MEDLITGIQQVGIGVRDAKVASEFYKRVFGMDVKIFDDRSSASLMTRYTGDQVHERHAVLAMNLAGGGGFEIWQFTSRTPISQPEIAYGDIGIYAIKIKAIDIYTAHKFYKNESSIQTSEILLSSDGKSFFWVDDIFGNRFQVVPCLETYLSPNAASAGVCGAIIGVTDMKKAISFYKNVLGIDREIYNKISSDLISGKQQQFHKVLLSKAKSEIGAFGTLLGAIEIELVAAIDTVPKKIYANRFWGDCGFIHLCFDVINMDLLKARAEKYEYRFSVDSESSFRMEDAAGRFCYIEDPDSTLIELVETHKIHILKSMGWYLDLTKRKGNLPIPKWMIRMLSFSKI